MEVSLHLASDFVLFFNKAPRIEILTSCLSFTLTCTCFRTGICEWRGCRWTQRCRRFWWGALNMWGVWRGFHCCFQGSMLRVYVGLTILDLSMFETMWCLWKSSHWLEDIVFWERFQIVLLSCRGMKWFHSCLQGIKFHVSSGCNQSRPCRVNLMEVLKSHTQMQALHWWKRWSCGQSVRRPTRPFGNLWTCSWWRHQMAFH